MYILQQKLQLPLLRGSAVLWLNIIVGWKHKQIKTVSLKGDMTVASVLTIARSTITCSNSSKDYSITEQLGLEGPLVSSSCPAQSRVCHSRLLRAVQLGFATSKNGNATISLGNLFHCLTTSTVEKPTVSYTEIEFPICAHCLLSCHQAPPRKAWLPHFYSLTRYLCTMTRSLCPVFSRLSSHSSHNLLLYEGSPVP